MKRIFTCLLVCIGLMSMTATAPNPDDIIGTWVDGGGQAHLQIYKEGTKYHGKIVWLKVPNWPKTGTPKLDINNPDKSLQSKPLLGLQILRNFVYDDGEWNGGRIYDPQNGKDYRCYLKMKDLNTLSMRGYIGISLLGRTEVWTRVK